VIVVPSANSNVAQELSEDLKVQVVSNGTSYNNGSTSGKIQLRININILWQIDKIRNEYSELFKLQKAMRVCVEKENKIRSDHVSKTALESRINDHIFNLEQLDNSSDAELVKVRNEIERLTNEIRNNNAKIQESATIICEIEKQIAELSNNQGKTVQDHIAERDLINDTFMNCKTILVQYEDELTAIPGSMNNFKIVIEQYNEQKVINNNELQR